MSYEQAQFNLPDTGSLIRENNSLRLMIDSLQEELQRARFSSSGNPSLENQILSLQSENQHLLFERNQLIQQLQNPHLTETTPGRVDHLREKLEELLDENQRLNDLINEMRQLNSQRDRASQDPNLQQERIVMQAQEISRLHKVLQDMEQQIDDLRNRNDFDTADPSIKLTLMELENQVITLGAEKERLNAVLSDRNREIEILQLKLSSMGSGFYRLDERSQSVGKVEDLMTEIEHLNSLLQEKDREIVAYRSQVTSQRASSNNLNILNPQQQREVDKKSGSMSGYNPLEETGNLSRIRQLEGKIAELEAENIGLHGEVSKRMSVSGPRGSAGDDLKNRTAHQEQLENEIRVLRVEIGKVKNAAEVWENRCRDLSRYETEVEESDKKFVALAKENERVNEVLSEKKREIEDLKRKVDSGPNTMVIAEKIAYLVEENQRVMMLLNEKNNEVESLKKYTSAPVETGTVGAAVPVGMRDSLLGSPQAARSRLIELERKLRFSEGETERVRSFYNERMRDLDSQKTRTKEATNQVEQWKGKYFEQENALVRVSQENSRLEHKVNTLKGEIERVTGLLEDKVRQVTDLQMRICDLLEMEGKMKNVLQDRERFEAQINRHKGEIAELTERSVRLDIVERRLKEVEKQFNGLIRENEDLKILLRDKDSEIGEVKHTMEDLEETSTKVFKLEEMLEMLAAENEKVAFELEDRTREVKEWKDKVKEWQSRNMKMAELEQRLEQMAEENEKLSDMIRKKERLVIEMQMREGENENETQELKVKELEETVKWLADENNVLKEELDRKDRGEENLRQRLETRDREDETAGEVQAKLVIAEAENAGLRQVLKEREEEIKRWRIKHEENLKVIQGEMELRSKIRTLQLESGELKSSIVDKNSALEDLVRKNNELEEIVGGTKRMGLEKVLICAEVERLWSDIIALRKEKELLEKKDIVITRASHRNVQQQSYDYGSGTGTGQYDEEVVRELGGMIDELSKENVRLESLIAQKERELEYYRERNAEFEKVEVYTGTLEVKVELMAGENDRLNSRIRDLQDQIAKLKERLQEKEIETERLTAIYSSKSGTSDGFNGLEYQMEIMREENTRLLKVNKDNLKDIDMWKGKYAALEEGYYRLGELEVRYDEVAKEAKRLKELLEGKDEEVEVWKRKYLHAKKRNPDFIGDYGSMERSVENLSQSHERLRENFNSIASEEDLFKGGMFGESAKLAGDSSLASIRKRIEQREKELRAIRGDDNLIADTLNLIGRSDGWENKDRRGYE